MTDQPEPRRLPDDVDEHVCKPGARVYYCPTGGEIESDCHGGFDVCCAHPDLHRPLLPCSSAHFQRQPHAAHSWEPQPGMDPVHCPGHSDPAATEPAGAVCTVTVTVHAPTPENATQWAQTISDLVTAEYGQEMRLGIQIGQPREMP